jgi:hypothetical protein
LKVQVGRRERTVRLGEEARLGRVAYDIDDRDLDFDDGYPTFGSLRAAALALLVDLLPGVDP